VTVLQPPPDRDLDLVCIGNAIVDVLAHADDGFLERHGMPKGGMQLIDTEAALRIYADMAPGIEASGGSAANTAAGVAALGGRVHFVGRVADDELGRVFAHDIRAIGVDFDTPAVTGHLARPGTARCLILVTPDAQRTMNTYLGVSAQLNLDDVESVDLTSSKAVYCEGYLYDEPVAKEAIRHAMDQARRAGTVVALSLSDSFCVDRHRADFLDLVENRVDILFANEAEICSLYEVESFDEAAERIAGRVGIACLTRSEHGSLIISDDGQRVAVPAAPTELVDTTGAGDLYAAGFLALWSGGAPLEECGRAASITAAEVISHLGPRPLDDLRKLVGID
jgi:sugar/nucleoside kinase (ribokinase family)